MLVKVLLQFLIFIAVICVLWLVLFGWPMSKAALIGRTPVEVRKQYGEPSYIQDHRKDVRGLNEYRWYYQRGWLGLSLVTFDNNDVVIDVYNGHTGH